jgi:hypothetical protein
MSRLLPLGIPTELHEQVGEIVRDEFRGLYHGSLVMFDGGSSLADRGAIKIVDDQGTPFMTHLHEIGFGYYDERG